MKYSTINSMETTPLTIRNSQYLPLIGLNLAFSWIIQYELYLSARESYFSGREVGIFQLINKWWLLSISLGW